MDAFKQAALYAHNQYRAAHGAPALSLDTNIGNTAQNYANKLANVNSGLVHSTGSGYGENLAMSMGRPLSTVDDCASMNSIFIKTIKSIMYLFYFLNSIRFWKIFYQNVV